MFLLKAGQTSWLKGSPLALSRRVLKNSRASDDPTSLRHLGPLSKSPYFKSDVFPSGRLIRQVLSGHSKVYHVAENLVQRTFST